MPASEGADEVDIGRLRAALVAAGARLGTRGLISAGEGNLSIRLPGDRLLITPAGLRKDELAPDEMLVVPIRPPAATPDAKASGDAAAAPDGLRGLRASSDVAIHRAVHAARPEAGAVAHAHLPAAMALTVAGEVPDPSILPEMSRYLPALPLVPFGEPGSEELAARVAVAFTSGPPAGAVLLERHGAVSVGAPGEAASGTTEAALGALAVAVNRLELVEVLCRTWRDALLIRAARGGP